VRELRTDPQKLTRQGLATGAAGTGGQTLHQSPAPIMSEDVITYQPSTDLGSSVQVRGLKKSYGPRVAIRGLDLDFLPGVTALLGRNGAGKSTLMRALATVAPADAGEVRVFGDAMATSKARLAYRRQLGWLPQQFNVPLTSTLRAYLQYVAWLKKVPARRRRGAASDAAESVGLHDRMDSRLGTLSGGMLRRAGLGQAIVNRPGILLLDEPTAGLDPQQRSDFALLVRRCAESTVVVLATHLLEDVALTADRVAVLTDGELAFDGSFEDFGGGPRGRVTVDDLSARFRHLADRRAAGDGQ
jgi:ABC-2 type transport system ATP-binding protein